MRKTFKQIYTEAKAEKMLTPSQLFIKSVAMLTRRSEETVRMWLKGMQAPDKLTTDVLAEYFGVEADGLFPTKQKEYDEQGTTGDAD